MSNDTMNIIKKKLEEYDGRITDIRMELEEISEELREAQIKEKDELKEREYNNIKNEIDDITNRLSDIEYEIEECTRRTRYTFTEDTQENKIKIIDFERKNNEYAYIAYKTDYPTKKDFVNELYETYKIREKEGNVWEFNLRIVNEECKLSKEKVEDSSEIWLVMWY